MPELILAVVPQTGDSYATLVIAVVTTELIKIRSPVLVDSHSTAAFVHETECSATERISTSAGPAEEIECAAFVLLLWRKFRLDQASVGTSRCLTTVASLFVKLQSTVLVPLHALPVLVKKSEESACLRIPAIASSLHEMGSKLFILGHP